jgi:hypothetical protein
MQKVAYAAIIIYDKINRGKEIPAAASIVQDASPNTKKSIIKFYLPSPYPPLIRVSQKHRRILKLNDSHPLAWRQGMAF